MFQDFENDRLRAALGKVDRPGAFCTGGDLPLVMPGLEIDALGTVRLPLGKAGRDRGNPTRLKALQKKIG